MAAKKSNFYLTREELIREIVLSKKKFRESNHPRTPAECFTPKLTEYLQLMVNKYANKGQWRGYCVDENTQALTKRGWLGIDQITENDIILSHSDGKLKWSKIKSIYRSDYDGHMFKLSIQGMDALVTPGHKFLTSEGLKPIEELRERDKLILFGTAADAPTEPVYTDALVELVGWTVTEANYYQATNRKYCRVTVYQNEGTKADRIRSCLKELNASFGESGRLNPSGHTNIAFSLSKIVCEQLVQVAPGKVLDMEFILALTQQQRELLIQTMIDADGHRSYDKYMNYTQCDKEHVDSFLALCTLAGYRTSVKLKPPGVGYGKKPIYSVRIISINTSVVESIDFHGGKNTNRLIGKPKSSYPNEPSMYYRGRVWCPETEYGVFIARRNGSIYLTGNSYISDMKSDALLTLCQNAFKYNEEKYDNPFGYYTQIIKYCFITFLEKEEVIRDIKDSLWESIGMTPSYARQIRNEQMKDAPDQSSKGLKALKKDIETLSTKIQQLGSLTSQLLHESAADTDIDWEISEALEVDVKPFTADLASTLTLFVKPPHYIVERSIEIAGNTVDCLSVIDESTKSRTQRVLSSTDEQTIIKSLCSIALSVRRDLLVKQLRELSGYNIANTRIPSAERMVPSQIDQEVVDEARTQTETFVVAGAFKRKGRRKAPD